MTSSACRTKPADMAATATANHRHTGLRDNHAVAIAHSTRHGNTKKAPALAFKAMDTIAMPPATQARDLFSDAFSSMAKPTQPNTKPAFSVTVNENT